jgi:transcriptional regulator with XRE-family HTH domain
MAQPEPLTATVAARVKELRKARGLSAAALADYMSRAGVPWQREVVANLEGGRRAAVSVTELLALSIILSVPPQALLMAPDARELSYVPNDSVDAYRGLLWLLSEQPFGGNGGAWEDAAIPVRLVRRHHEDAQWFSNSLTALSITERWAAEGRPQQRLEFDRLAVQNSVRQLRQTRREMRARGMFVPELVPEIVEAAAARGISIDEEEE